MDQGVALRNHQVTFCAGQAEGYHVARPAVGGSHLGWHVTRHNQLFSGLQQAARGEEPLPVRPLCMEFFVEIISQGQTTASLRKQPVSATLEIFVGSTVLTAADSR